MVLPRLAVCLAMFFGGAGAAQSPPPSLTPEVGPTVSSPPDVPAAIRVVSFNVHHGDDIPGLVRAIRSHADLCSADVWLLQEMEAFPAEGTSRTQKLAEALGLNYVYAPARLKEAGDGTHGLAILSRFPLSDVEVIPLKQHHLGVNTRRRIALGVTLSLNERRVRVYNVHLDTRINAGQRIEQLRAVVEAATRQPHRDVLIGGDFNTNPLYWLLPLLPVFRSNQAKAVDDYMKQNGYATPFAEGSGTVSKWYGKYRVDAVYARGLPVRRWSVESGVALSDHYPLWVDVIVPPSETERAER
ncbi:MAG TPA: endonuclease/exonuclease/phosphatase family protein [Candidatus Xenobia bacterium]|nr:endonuclease/exonuclease/phosphatase family protein [Candidatus Xenobia bacterium]